MYKTTRIGIVCASQIHNINNRRCSVMRCQIVVYIYNFWIAQSTAATASYTFRLHTHKFVSFGLWCRWHSNIKKGNSRKKTNKRATKKNAKKKKRNWDLFLYIIAFEYFVFTTYAFSQEVCARLFVCLMLIPIPNCTTHRMDIFWLKKKIVFFESS